MVERQLVGSAELVEKLLGLEGEEELEALAEEEAAHLGRDVGREERELREPEQEPREQRVPPETLEARRPGQEAASE